MATLGDLIPASTKPTLGSVVKAAAPAPAPTPSLLSFGAKPVAPQTGGNALPTLGELARGAADFGKDVVRSVTRTAGAIPGSINADVNQLLGTKFKTTVAPPDPTVHPVLSKAYDIVFGKDAIPDLQDQIAQTELDIKKSPFAQTIGADKHALPLAFAGVIGGDALNLLPFGGAEKNAAKNLLKETTEEGTLKILKKLNVPDEVSKVFAPHFATAKTAKEVEDGLKLMKGTLGLKQIAPEVEQIGKQGAQAIEEMPNKTTPLPEPLLADAENGGSKALQDTPIDKNTVAPEVSPLQKSVSLKDSSINLDRIKVGDTATAKIISTLEEIRPELEQAKGAPLTHAEVLKAAQESTILTKATSRESVLKSEAALLATRQNLASLAEGKGVTSDFIDQLRIVSAEASRRGRELNALGIGADPIANTTKGELVKKLLDAGIEADKIIKASEGVDFNNLSEVTKFYRDFIKPTKTEWLDEYRYINLLSSPKTHIINAFSNLIQGTILNPATRLATGALDSVMAGLTGRERSVYAKEVPAYYRGFLEATPRASKAFFEAMKGNIRIERPDVSKIATGSKLLAPFQAVPRLLEASDVFFRTLITEGEKQAIASRYVKQGKELTDVVLNKIEEEAKANADYYVFRKALDGTNKTGQGHVLSAIDKATSSIYSFRKVPGIKWFIPFVQTPMNILKQGLEYSPLGISTLPGATNKTTQLAKTMIGSTVFLGAASLGAQGRLTWAAPTSEKEKNAFYNSGRQPYSVKIGDSWVSFSKLGPLAYPMAMAASMQWYLHENPKAATQTAFERTASALQGIAGFFSDQSYMTGLKSLIDFTSGDTKLTGIQSVFSSLGGQLVPLDSLLRWTNQITNPVFRQPDSEFNLKNLLQSIEKDIPVLSANVQRIPGSLKRQNPLLNAFSPVQINPANKKYENDLQNIRKKQKQDARLKAIKDRAKS